MKKILAVLCFCLMMISFPAQAADDFKLDAEITGTRLVEKWNGETSEENSWFAVDLKLTNWHVEEQKIADLLSGRLVFKDAYHFEAVPEFNSETISPLAEKEGSLVFTIPKMVSRMFSPQDVKVYITVDGEEREVETENAGAGRPAHSAGTLEGPGYDSPEDAVMAFLEGMNDGDAPEMLSTFAIESFVEHADPEDYLRRLRTFNLSLTNGIPYGSDYDRSLKVSVRYGEIARALMMQYVEKSAHTEGMPLPLNDEEALQDLLAQFTGSPVNDWSSNVEFVEWIDPVMVSHNFYSVVNLRNIATQMACAGADDYAELAAHIRLNGVDAIQFMECIRYGDRWFNLNVQGNLANLYGLDSYSAGLLYPWNGILDTSGSEEPETEGEFTEFRNSWESSDLAGTHWIMESFDVPGYSVNAADSEEAALNDAGMSVFMDLKFMHLGGAVLNCRLSREMVEQGMAGSDYMKTTAVWGVSGGRIMFRESKGIWEEYADLDYAEFIRKDDTLTMSVEGEGTVTFRRIEE